MQSKLLRKVHHIGNLEQAWHVIRENGRLSKSDDVKAELQDFAEDASSNLRRLQRRLARSLFQFAPAKGVPLPKLDAQGKPTGKFRPIVLAPVESRIVQRALLNVLLTVPALRPYVKTPYSFGGLRRDRPTGAKGDSSGRSAAPSAVPAAIKAALDQIGQGARFWASADISSFFTRISKPTVTGIVASAVNDPEFVAFFELAIQVELSNMAALRTKVDEFPIEEIGVAQGNSLSPLLGNIILADFDNRMNEGNARCIRYIDDFIILAPTIEAGNARLRKAIGLLAKLGMDLSPEKSSKGARSINEGFEFLGIEVHPGLVRPALKAQAKLMAKVEQILDDGRRALVGLRNGQAIDRSRSLMAVLRRLDETVHGWSKHYWFCNDGQILEHLDERIWKAVAGYLGLYSEVRSQLDEGSRPPALGLTQLQAVRREPFEYPSVH